MLVHNPYPQTPFPRERLCMLGWLCIVQSPCAYTPGIRAGAECGAAALTPLRATPQTPFLITIEVFRLTEQPFRAVMYIVR